MFRHDLSFALRLAVTRPVFSSAVILTLALGIGANTLVFSLVNGVLLRPLPYPAADRLYTLAERDSLGQDFRLTSYPTFLDWHDQNSVFDALAYIRGTGLTLQTDDRTGLLLGAFVSDEFFRALDLPALRGRALGAADYDPGTGPVAVLAHHVWRDLFGGRDDVIGETVVLATGALTVVGVLPPEFAYPNWGEAETDLWLPITALPPNDLAALRQRDFNADSRIVARLDAGASAEAAQQQMNEIAVRLAVAYPDASGRWTRVFMMSLKDFVVGNATTQLWVLAAAVFVVLLIVCVNLANLYLAQSTVRGQEFAIRAAIGAGRGRVIRQLLVETLLLTTIGGSIGVLGAGWSVAALRSRAPDWLPRMSELHLDTAALLFAIGLSAVTAFMFALIGVMRAGSIQLTGSLGGRTSSFMRHKGRRALPGTLVIAQVALTVMLLIGAGLLLRSFWRLSHVDPGFDPRNLVAAWIYPPSPAYDQPDAAIRLYDALMERIRAVPGVTDVGLINHMPLGGGSLPTRAALGGPPASADDYIGVLPRTVSAGYFALMGIPVIEGREFDDADVRTASGPLIVNDVLARAWGDESPVGRQLTVLKAAKERADFGQPLTGTVVGVVGSVKHFGLDSGPNPVVYLPYTATPWSTISVVARTTASAEAFVRPIDQAIREVDPALPVDGKYVGARPALGMLRDSYAEQRFNTLLVGGFGVCALLLAAVGIYGVIAFAVVSQTREIGIRLALGSTPSQVERRILVRGARLTVAGLALGTLGAAGLARFIRSLLFDVEPTDALTYVTITGIFLAVAGIASFLPARRAASVDPLTALRAE